MRGDRLIEVPRADLQRLRDLYLPDWPLHIAGYSVVETCVRWIRQHGAERASRWFEIYSLNGDWSDGTFVCVVSFRFVKPAVHLCTSPSR